jgi:hypothetical protein
MMRIIGLSNPLAQEPAPMTKSYQIVPPPGSHLALDPKRVAELLAKDDDLIDVRGRAICEQRVAGEQHVLVGQLPDDQRLRR